jgi:23S rRNA (uracil1939-C5)-methyltransferase
MRAGRARRTAPVAGELVEVEIAALGGQGDGMSADGALFVPYTLPGDRVAARRIGPHHALPVEWRVRASGHAVPACAHFGTCGGCALQHLAEAEYAAWKVAQLERALAHRGFDAVALAPLVRAAPGMRRRADLGVARGDTVEIGFHAFKSRTLVDMRVCPVLMPAIVNLLPALRELFAILMPPDRTADALITVSETGRDLLIGRVHDLDQTRREAIAAFARCHDLARIAWRRAAETPETIVQLRPPRVTFGGVAVDVPPAAFLQATVEGERAIVAEATDACQGARRIADLYAGLGTLSFPLGHRARVHAVEGMAALVGALEATARRAGLSGRITAETRDLARRPLRAAELDAFDAVVFDPPRDGAAAQAAEIARSRVKTVVAVSCNPSTFARDARVLADGGYRFERITPIDQFLWSPHLELVAVFQR